MKTRSGATPDNVSDEEEGEVVEDGERKDSGAEEADDRDKPAPVDDSQGRWGGRESPPSRGRRGRSRTPSRSPTPRRNSGSRASSFDDQGRLDENRDDLIKEIEEEIVQDEEEEEVKDFRDDLPPYLPSVSGCRSVEEFQCLNRIEEGTYGVVYRARDKVHSFGKHFTAKQNVMMIFIFSCCCPADQRDCCFEKTEDGA